MEPFVYTAKSGEDITLVNFAAIPAGVFRRCRALSGMEQTFAVIEAGADEENLAKVDALPVSELEALFTEWSDGADVPNS